jgi:hypothetical protein
MSSGAGTQTTTITAGSAAGITIGTFTGDVLNTSGVVGTVGVTALANNSLGNTFIGGNGATTITASAGPDSITTGSGADSVTLTGGGSDIVSTGAGNDTITTTGTNTGSIIVDGGAGTDTLVFNNAVATAVTAMTGVEQILLTLQTAGANVTTQAGLAAVPSSAISSSLGINVTGTGSFGLTVNMDTNSVNLTQPVTATAFTDAGGIARTIPTAATNLFIVNSTSANDVITAASAGLSIINLVGGADTVNMGTSTHAVVQTAVLGTAAQTLGATNLKTLNNVVTTVDKIQLTIGVGAASSLGFTVAAGSSFATMGAVVTDATAVNSFADVQTRLAIDLLNATNAFAASATGAGNLVARIVTFSTGTAAGSYLVLNDNNISYQAASDPVILLTGTTTLVAADLTVV